MIRDDNISSAPAKRTWFSYLHLAFLVNPVLIRFNLCYAKRSLSFKRLNEFVYFVWIFFFSLLKIYATVCHDDFMLLFIFRFAEFQVMTFVRVAASTCLWLASDMNTWIGGYKCRNEIANYDTNSFANWRLPQRIPKRNVFSFIAI